jgi:hypothetical protein
MDVKARKKTQRMPAYLECKVHRIVGSGGDHARS